MADLVDYPSLKEVFNDERWYVSLILALTVGRQRFHIYRHKASQSDPFTIIIPLLYLPHRHHPQPSQPCRKALFYLRADKYYLSAHSQLNLTQVDFADGVNDYYDWMRR